MIRTAELKDLDTICEIESQFGAEAFSKRSLRRFVTKDQTIVMTVNDVVLAYAILLVKANSPRARLYSIAVAQSHQRKGLAKKLMESLESFAIMWGKMAIGLEVSSRNAPALSLYASMGYKRLSEVQGYYKDGSSAVKMAKDLSYWKR